MVWKAFTGVIITALLIGAMGVDGIWEGSADAVEPISRTEEGKPFVLTGTMRLLDIQGGCWVLETEGGERFQLDGTPEQLQLLRREGARVSIWAVKAPDRYGSCMVGTWVRVIRIIRTG